MKILHVVPTYLPAWRHGGPIHSVHGLCKGLVARGHEVTVFTTDVNGADELTVPLGQPVDRDGVGVLYFPVRLPRRVYYSPAMGEALAGSVGGFDLVHLHSIFLWPTYAAARAAERAGVPYLVAPRGMLVRELVRRRGRIRKTVWLHLVERRTLQRASGLHVTGEVEAREARWFPLDLPAAYEVPNGVDPVEVRRPDPDDVSPSVREVAERSPFFLALGRLSWKKGLDLAVEAMVELPEATLVLAGNDEEGLWSRLAKLAGRCGVADRVTYTGPVSGADKAALLHAAKALVLPSQSENFGNVVLEAMAARCPVVVTPEVGVASVVAEVGCGLVVDPHPASLAGALRRILEELERCREMGLRGAEVARERFSWPVIAAQMEEVYETVLGHPRTGPRMEEPAIASSR